MCTCCFTTLDATFYLYIVGHSTACRHDAFRGICLLLGALVLTRASTQAAAAAASAEESALAAAKHAALANTSAALAAAVSAAQSFNLVRSML